MAPLNQDPHYQHDDLFQAQMNKPLIPPTSEVKLANLCAKCSGALFHDGHGGFKEKLDDNQSPRLLFPVKSYHENYRKIWTDSIPSLPRIEKSALGGCDFCLFLHNSILSRDVDNMLVQSIGKKQAELDTQEISISVAYCWSSGSPDIYRDLYGGDTVEKEVCSRQDIFSAEDDECEEYHLDDAEYFPTEGENLGKGHDSVETETGIKLDDGQLEGLLIRLESRATGEYIPPFYLCCYATQTSGSEVAGNWLGLALPSSQDYSEPHRAEWMKQALRKCEAHNHELTDEHFAPERLIDVSSPKPRLVLRGEYQMSQTNPYVPTYAALSYCWGPPEDASLQLTTTKETFEKRRRGIENHEMTQVLKDAVFIARELGIPYLWIDALCITQGDTGDWERQSVDMSKIYGNSKVTLCAASSMSCRESFLRQRGSRIRMPFRSTLQPSITGSFDVQFKYARMATNGPRIFSHRGMDVFDLDLSQANWSGRGWVFQERFSSRCKLSFGNSFIHYLCDEGSQRMAKSLIDGPWFMSLSATLDGDSEELYHSWRSKVLRRYARFNVHSFTNHTDLLPALSGLARCFNQRLQDDFLAGFWRKDLLRSLLWFVRYYVDGGYPPHESEFLPFNGCYTVPSWSILGRGYPQGNWKYDWRLKGIRPATQLLQATTDLESGNPFGAITGGRLTIRGRILDFACLDRDAISIISEGCIESYYPYELRYNVEVVGRFILDFRYTKLVRDKSCYGTNESKAIIQRIGSLKWVLLGKCCWEHGLGDGAFGLILRQVPHSRGLFHRVGVFSPPWGLEISYGLSMFKKLGKTRTVVVV